MQSVNSALGGCLNPDAPEGCILLGPIPAPSPEEPLRTPALPPGNQAAKPQRAPSNEVTIESKSSNSSGKTAIIAGATALAVGALLLMLVIIFVVRQRKQRAASKVSEGGKRRHDTPAGTALESLALPRNASGWDARYQAGPNARPAPSGADGEREASARERGETLHGDGELRQGHMDGCRPTDCKPAPSLASPPPVAAVDKGYTSTGTVPLRNASGIQKQLPNAMFGFPSKPAADPWTYKSGKMHSGTEPQVPFPALPFLPVRFYPRLASGTENLFKR
jgi:hypothetical protein